jgi:hypothetical protein
LISKSLRGAGTFITRTRRHPPWIMFENNPQIHERQILDISECPKLVADVDPPIGPAIGRGARRRS